MSWKVHFDQHGNHVGKTGYWGHRNQNQLIEMDSFIFRETLQNFRLWNMQSVFVSADGIETGRKFTMFAGDFVNDYCTKIVDGNLSGFFTFKKHGSVCRLRMATEDEISEWCAKHNVQDIKHGPFPYTYPFHKV